MKRQVRVEFLYSPKEDNTLILVWDYQQIIHRALISGEIDVAEMPKIIKKYKRKFK